MCALQLGFALCGSELRSRGARAVCACHLLSAACFATSVSECSGSGHYSDELAPEGVQL